MPPSEATILSNFLLTPAPLPAFMKLEEFINIFPTKYHSNPRVKELWRELQAQRNQDIEQVRSNIAAEVNRGEKQRRQIKRVRRVSHDNEMTGLDAAAMEMEGELFGLPKAPGPGSEPHTLHTVHSTIGRACISVEAHIAELESEIEGVLSEVSEAVGALSDLRYGRLSKSRGSGDDIVADVISALKHLESACEETEDKAEA